MKRPTSGTANSKRLRCLVPQALSYHTVAVVSAGVCSFSREDHLQESLRWHRLRETTQILWALSQAKGLPHLLHSTVHQLLHHSRVVRCGDCDGAWEFLATLFGLLGTLLHFLLDSLVLFPLANLSCEAAWLLLMNIIQTLPLGQGREGWGVNGVLFNVSVTITATVGELKMKVWVFCLVLKCRKQQIQKCLSPCYKLMYHQNNFGNIILRLKKLLGVALR